MSKPQSKTQKKIDNHVRQALTSACEQFLEDIPGFQWLTHQANYTNFPASLLVTCVFDSRDNQQSADIDVIVRLIQSKLLKIGVKFKSPRQQIIFDCEESCSTEDDGDWNRRLGRRDKRSVASNRPL